MHKVTSFISAEIPLELGVQMNALSQRVWPSGTPADPQEEARKKIAVAQEYAGPPEQAPMSYAVLEDGELLAMAHTFSREIETTAGRMKILALAGVVVDKPRRGEGLGRDVVKAAFKRVDNGTFAYSLFQTTEDNRGFYKKLGATFIDNQVVNSLAPEGPGTPAFWDTLVVRYADGPGWPVGEIDLRGPGY